MTTSASPSSYSVDSTIILRCAESPEENTAPYFLTNVTSVFTINIGDDWEYSLPNYKDDQQQKVTITCSICAEIKFLILDSNQLKLDWSEPEAQLAQQLRFNITLTDSLELSSSYAITLILKAPTKLNGNDQSSAN